MGKLIVFNTIEEFHDYFDLPKPKNPLISVIHHHGMNEKLEFGKVYKSNFFHIGFREGQRCSIIYGDNTYEFDNRSMHFLAPGQTYAATSADIADESTGWGISFHPDFIRRADLGKKIQHYNFFNYDVHESLLVSENERSTLNEITSQIEDELFRYIDRYSQSLIRSNLELLLNYCVRFYDRQFLVRTHLNKDYVGRFNELLNEYYSNDSPLELGLPTVQYCGQALGLSPYYLSDVLKRETGKNALESIHLFIMGKAKEMILNNNSSITQIAINLGFEYPQHFSKLFKQKVGMTPRAFKTTMTK